MLETRDHDVREFAEGRGYPQLFQEVLSLSGALPDNDAGVALFEKIHQQDKQLARQCFRYIEDTLMQRGKYELCLEYVGDPQAGFEALHQTFNRVIESQQRAEQMQKQFPAPANLPPQPDMRQMATNSFVGEVRKLVEILVATGHQADAEKIRNQAVKVFDDPRLESAVSDTVAKLHLAEEDKAALQPGIRPGHRQHFLWRPTLASLADAVRGEG